ncbi:Rpn family recombination-promoting nuclease/putative transposase [Caldifermentibacillus hisashii]|uniref:Rpn family recombination-promoting nuclease/putative transposase n=1 Tax=Caldifermentibacillus hisashii TaxID=996558 RepID=UPI0031B6A935
MKIQNPHDRFFRESMGNVTTAKDFFTHYLPKNVLQIIDLNTLEPQKDSFINQELEEGFSDLLFKADISGKEGYLYFLFEHKSYPDKGISLQLLKYMVEIWEAKMNKEGQQQLPIVIPLVIYHGKTSWSIPTSLGANLNGYEELPKDVKVHVPDFDYIIYDLSGFSDEEIKGKVQTRILLTLLRDIFTKDIDELIHSILKCIHYLLELEDKQTGIEFLETMIRYVFSAAKYLTKDDMNKIRREIETTFPEGSEVTMTLADILREEGMKKGWEEGLEKGIEKGIELGQAKALSKIALQQLTEKFGVLPRELTEKISKLDVISLELILSNIFNYTSLDDVRKFIS